ncbi:sensor domain-containing protein [Virgibacillus sp. W0430]|uniref:sensor domain-containing protein n=1 Tax=Virgibacillus sp. W0430 TaxID=3391580 RepID=UPI003F474C9F
MGKKHDHIIETKVLNAINEAVLFVHEDGTVLRKNNAARTLFNLGTNKVVSIYELLDFADVIGHKEVNVILELKKQLGSWVKVKSLQIEQEQYCLIVRKLSLKDKMNGIDRFFQSFIEASEEGMIIHDGEKIIDCDATFARMFGYKEAEVKGQRMTTFFRKKRYKNNSIVKKANEYTGIKKNGTTFYVEVIGQSYFQDDVIRVEFIKDISERIQYERQIELMAYYDELTGLPNRNYFMSELEATLEHVKLSDELIAVHFIDLDYFKEINDTLGYDFGDKLLQACANRLRTFSDQNPFIARMGGDEFLVLQRNIRDVNMVTQFAEHLISEFETPIKISGYEMVISVSIGISIYPNHGRNVQDLIKHANSAMYVTKEEHRNNYHVFEASISRRFKQMLMMENDLRKALKKGQFELHYQPQKNIKTKKVVGMEALLRWKHPIKGYIPPMEFIPLAEKTGLIIEIGDWVMNEACKQNKRWQDEGFDPIVISVNLSVKQFHQKNLVNKTKQILQETGLEAQYLELELTESMAMANDRNILDTIESLRQLGVSVSIDDFGTGYSSLKYLSFFPITKLKIDKMFMDEKQEQNKAIVKSIIHMSHSLNMKVIAEGVETIEQLNFLRDENCDEIQGFYFSKPLPPHRLTKFFRH